MRASSTLRVALLAAALLAALQLAAAQAGPGAEASKGRPCEQLTVLFVVAKQCGGRQLESKAPIMQACISTSDFSALHFFP